MSTISRSPGSAPSTAIGPLSTCTPGNGAFRMSSAESSLWIAPSNHPPQSPRKAAPRPPPPPPAPAVGGAGGWGGPGGGLGGAGGWGPGGGWGPDFWGVLER